MAKNEGISVVIKVAKFAVIILVVDILFGTLSKQLFFSQETGKYARSTYAIKETKAEILIFGSSHAHRHYVPEVFEKELNRTCYNAGAEGQQLLYHLALQQMILKRMSPKIMVLNIDENFLYQSQVAYDRLSDLHPYYAGNKEVLEPILSLNNSFVDAKLFFKSFQTNSTLVHAIRYYMAPQKDYQGYRPLFDKMKPTDKTKLAKENDEKEYVEVIDQNFVQAFKDFIKVAKKHGARLVFVSSPNLFPKEYSKNTSLVIMKEIAEKEKIPFLDFFNSKQFSLQYELFHDPSHLNDDGARLFSKLITESIKSSY